VARVSERKADQLVDDLLRRIVRSELAVGSLLPKEAELAQQYEVNRSVVREAVKQLEVHHLVRPVKRLGTVVLDPLRSPSPDVLRAMIMPRAGVVDRAALAELLEIRAKLDMEMSVLAAERRDEDDLARMRACLVDLSGALGDPDRYADIMNELNLVVAHATHNRIYQMLVHWHSRVRMDLPILEMVIRIANEPHLQGVQFWMHLIETQQVDALRSFVSAVHAWSIPRMLEAVALTHSQPASATRAQPTNPEQRANP
jgi:DNA-binding FadR family transcriptional regulator